MNKYRVTYNGYTVEFFDNMEMVEDWITDKLHDDLAVKLLSRQKISVNTPEKSAEIRIYQYYTLYSEMFLIETM